MITYEQPGRKEKPYKNYNSPLRKLVKFFEDSRNRWKNKCKEAKRLVKYLKKRVAFLEKSRAEWKSRAKAAEAKLVELKVEQEALAKELAHLKEMKSDEQPLWGTVGDFGPVPARHQYPVGQAVLFIGLVLSAAASLRGAAQGMKLVFNALDLPLEVPAWTTGRLWLLRVGYYKLTRPKPKSEDWVWIVDHTLQLGPEKCLVILGIRLSDLPADRPVGHEDVEPIALFPIKGSNGTVVYQQLEEAAQQTGVPREIIADYGSDLKAGIQAFCDTHPQTVYIYDIKHKTAAILKHELQKDEAWSEFTRLAGQSKIQVQQTALASLSPPNQKSKARYMNLAELVRWGQNMLAFFDQSSSKAMFDPAAVEEKFGWLIRFRPDLDRWAELFQMVETTESFVRSKGLYLGAADELAALLPAQTERGTSVRQHLLAFVAEQAAKAEKAERLLGSSEVIESVFGKLKRLEQDQAQNGFTGLLLSIAAMVSSTNTETVQKALETVSTRQVWTWCKEKLGQSLQSKRRIVFAFVNKTEQKRDHLCQPP